MELNKILLPIVLTSIFLSGCQKKESADENANEMYQCYEYTIEDLVTGNEYHRCSSPSKKGSIKFLIPKNWMLDSTRLVEVRVLQGEKEGEALIIGEVINIAMNADPSEFIVVSKPQDISEIVPIQGYASWSWCLKPRRSGTVFLCFEVDIAGEKFGQKVLSKSIAIPIGSLPFWNGLTYYFLNNTLWIIPLGSFIITVLALIKNLIPSCGHRKINKKLSVIEGKIDDLSAKDRS